MKKFTDYWRQNLGLGRRRAWDWMGARGILIDVVISMIVGLLITQSLDSRWRIGLTALVTIGIALAIYLLLILVFTAFIVPYQENIKLDKIVANYKRKGKEPPEIQKLAELRTEGVALRNFGARLNDPNYLPGWISDYTEWDKKVLKTLSKLSKGKAAWLTTLDRMPLYTFQNALNDDHMRYLRIFEEKLKRLDVILRQYLNIPQN